MLVALITAKTRRKLLHKFFLNTNTKSYLRKLERELGESSNAIRVELNRLEKANLLIGEHEGSRKYYFANTAHPIFNELNSILKKALGIDKILDDVIQQISGLNEAWITGDFAEGKKSQIIDLVFIGNNIDTHTINTLTSKVEQKIERKIRYLILSAQEMKDYFNDKPALLIWQNK